MKAVNRIILAVALVALLLATSAVVAVPAGTCPDLVVPAYVLAQHSETRRFVEVEDGDQIGVLLAWDGVSNWIGYGRGGWLVSPIDIISMIYLYPEDYDEAVNPWGFQLLVVYGNPNHPDIALPMLFTRLDLYADNNGDHYGMHPCAAWAMERAEVEAWLAEVAGS